MRNQRGIIRIITKAMEEISIDIECVAREEGAWVELKYQGKYLIIDREKGLMACSNEGEDIAYQISPDEAITLIRNEAVIEVETALESIKSN